MPPSIDRFRTPNSVATVPLVSGTVDSHKKAHRHAEHVGAERA
jgi:hypothetical protein